MQTSHLENCPTGGLTYSVHAVHKVPNTIPSRTCSLDSTTIPRSVSSPNGTPAPHLWPQTYLPHLSYLLPSGPSATASFSNPTASYVHSRILIGCNGGVSPPIQWLPLLAMLIRTPAARSTDAYYQELLGASISMLLLAQATPIAAYSDCSSAIKRTHQAQNVLGPAIGHLQHGSLLLGMRHIASTGHPWKQRPGEQRSLHSGTVGQFFGPLAMHKRFMPHGESLTLPLIPTANEK